MDGTMYRSHHCKGVFYGEQSTVYQILLCRRIYQSSLKSDYTLFSVFYNSIGCDSLTSKQSFSFSMARTRSLNSDIYHSPYSIPTLLSQQQYLSMSMSRESCMIDGHWLTLVNCRNFHTTLFFRWQRCPAYCQLYLSSGCSNLVSGCDGDLCGGSKTLLPRSFWGGGTSYVISHILSGLTLSYLVTCWRI